MRPEGREGYREAHEKLLELQGVGPKVADCVCLMGLGWGESVPVDTHGTFSHHCPFCGCCGILTHYRTVWQIAQRDYKFGKGAHKSLTKATYDAVGNHFRKLWGQEAGWAQSVLFTANLRTFSDRLVASKKEEVEVKVKDESDENRKAEVTTKVTTTTAAVRVKRSASESKVKTEPSDEKDVKAIVETQTTRRMSKRLRNR